MPIEILRPATREEWLSLRKLDVTASQAAALLGAHPYTTAYQLWADKTGRSSADHEENGAMRRGRLLEPVVIAMLREERPDWIIEYQPESLTYFRDTDHRIGATPDAFATIPGLGGRGIVQAKTCSDWSFRQNWLDPDSHEVVLPIWIAVQAIVEADLTGAQWAVVAVLVVGHGIDLHVIDIPLHEGVRARLHEAVADFWAIVEKGGHPPIDWMKDARAVLDVYRDVDDDAVANLSEAAGFDDLVARYHAAKAREKDGREQAEQLRPQIISALGNASIGETLAWYVSAKVQHRKAYEVKASSSRVLRVKQKQEA
jgi:hypothetical protein